MVERQTVARHGSNRERHPDRWGVRRNRFQISIRRVGPVEFVAGDGRAYCPPSLELGMGQRVVAERVDVKRRDVSFCDCFRLAERNSEAAHSGSCRSPGPLPPP